MTTTADAGADADTRGERPTPKYVPTNLAFGWDKGFLVIRHDDVMARYNTAYLSPSTAKSMQGCAAKWAAEKGMPESQDPFSASEVGTSAHSVLEDFFGLPGSERTEDTAMAILIAHSKQMWPNKSDSVNRAKWITEVYNAYKGLFEIEDVTQAVVKQTEMRAEGVEIVGVPFKGFIDRVDLTPDGTKPIDYKSGKKMPNLRYGDEHGDQIRLYAEVIRVLLGEMPKSGALYYTRLGKAREVSLTKPKMREVLGRFARSWDNLNTYVDQARFPTKTSTLCGWCPLVNSCPSASADGLSDRKGGAPSKVDLGIPVLRTYDAADLTPAARREAKKREPVPPIDSGYYADEPVAEPEIPADPRGDLDVPANEPAADAEFLLAAGSELDAAAHADGNTISTSDLTDQESTMPTLTPYYAEGKTWEQTVDGHLNLNSYAASAVFATVNLAYEVMHEQKVKPTASSVQAFAQTLAHIADQAEEHLTGRGGRYQTGANQRMRGAMRAYIAHYPAPFGGDAAAWQAWVETGIKHARLLTRVALALHDDEAPEQPWAALAVGQPVTAGA